MRIEFKLASLLLVVCLAMSGGCSKSESGPVAASNGSPSTPTAPAPATPKPAVGGVVQASHSAPAAPTEQGDPIVVLHTSLGELYVRLYERQAPRSVANFIDYARVGHYNGTILHRIEPGFIALGGGYDERRQPKPVRYPIANEATNGLKNVRGSLAMARDSRDPNGATSQFFLNLADNPSLDHRGTTPEEFGYAVFGQVIDGLDVLDKISQAPLGTVGGFEKTPTPAIVVNSIKPVFEPKSAAVGDEVHKNFASHVGFGR